MIKSKVRPGFNNPFTLAHISIGYIEHEILLCNKVLEYADDIKKELGHLPEGCQETYDTTLHVLPLLEEALEYKKSLLVKDPSKLEFYQEAKS